MLDDIYFCEDCNRPEAVVIDLDNYDEDFVVFGEFVNEIYMIKLILEKYNVESLKDLEFRLQKSSDFNAKSFDIRCVCGEKKKTPENNLES